MIKIENVEVVGWEHAIRGMRNPMNSWDKSDSGYCGGNEHIGCLHCSIAGSKKHNQEMISIDARELYGVKPCGKKEFDGSFCIGHNDLDLMHRLRNAGTDHRKFMRMIVVYDDITAPLYWWKEYDTYKVGTVANSCSTMHKIHEKEFTLEDFSCEHLISEGLTNNEDGTIKTYNLQSDICLSVIITTLNTAREMYLKTKDKKYWWQMIQLLPSSYNQKRTVMLNYEVLANMYHSRKNHKLDEWRAFCKWVESLPYAKELICNE